MENIQLRDFGILPEDIKNVNYLLGLDFGHGETTLAYWKFTGQGVGNETPIDLKFDTNNGEPKKLLSALYVNQKGEYMLLSSNQSVPERPIYMGFKRKPELLLTDERYPGDDNMTCKQLIQSYIRMAISNAVKAEKNNAIVDLTGSGILVVGCPSSEEWLSYAIEYARILTEGIRDCGLNLKVIVMPESRASILKVYHQKKFDNYEDLSLKDVLQRGAMVFDFGSSTLDVTIANFITNTMWDNSIPLGASLIEEMMLEKALEENGCDEDNLSNISQSKLSMRVAKENYFTTYEKHRYYIMCKDDEDIRVIVNDDFINTCVETILTGYYCKNGPVEGTWKQLASQFMESCKEVWLRNTGASDYDGLIMLTGGASRMQFVKELAAKHFPNATNVSDADPSYCVSRGLIYALNTDLLSIALADKVEDEVTNNILPTQIAVFRAATGRRLSDFIYKHLANAMDNWVVNGHNVTFNQMVKAASSDLMTNHQSDIEMIIIESFREFLSDNSENSLRNTIASVVMNTYEEMFPGKINTENMQEFQIPDDFWSENAEIGKTVNFDTNSILLTLDLDSAIKTGMIVVFIIPLVALTLTLALIDGLFDTNLADWLGNFFQTNGNRIYNQQQRTKSVERLRKRKDKTLEAIFKSIQKTFLAQGTPEAENLSQQISDIIKPVVAKSINQVSLYF